MRPFRRWPLWLRWALVPVVALLADTLTQTVGRITLLLMESRTAGLGHLLVAIDGTPYLAEAIWQVLGPVVFVYGGTLVAPHRRLRAAIGLASFKTCVSIVNASNRVKYISRGGAWTDAIPPTMCPAWWTLCMSLAAIAAVAYMCIHHRWASES